MWSTIRKIAISVGFGTGLTGVVVAGTGAVYTAIADMPYWMTALMAVISILSGTLAFTFIGQLLEMWGAELLAPLDDEPAQSYPVYAGPGLTAEMLSPAPLSVIRDEEYRHPRDRT